MNVGDKVLLQSTSEWAKTGPIQGNGNPLNVEGTIIQIRTIKGLLPIVVLWSNGIRNAYNYHDLITTKTTEMSTKTTMKNAVVSAATTLLNANNTVTTLEIKTKLRKDQPNFYWSQATVSSIMDELAKEGKYIYTDNGTYRIYSDPTSKRGTTPAKTKAPKATKTVTRGLVKGSATALAAGKKAAATRAANKGTTAPTARISRTKALDLIKNNKGHFFTAVFTKVDGSERTMNAQYLKDQDQSALGYIKVREASKMKAIPSDCTRQINLQTLKKLKIGGVMYTVK